MRRWTMLAARGVIVWCSSTAAGADSLISRDYEAVAQPLLKSYCYECHSGEVTEAELDFASYGTDADVRRHSAVWVKVRDVLATGDMPPRDADQPSDEHRAQLLRWVRTMVAEEALRHAGDPGPVGLRRLDNAEYNYVLRDLMRLPDLDLTHEFPVDGAAGEGFTNVSSGQGMSPAMVQKYLDAGKAAADHLMLLPDGLRFSPATTQRDQTDELLAGIQAFYRRFTADGGGTAINLQGVQFQTNQGGLLPLDRYLAATIEFRDALRSGQTPIAAVARERELNPRYLQTLWTALADLAGSAESDLLLVPLRARWEQAGPTDVPVLTQMIASGQEALWKFNPVGQIVPGGPPKRWMEPVSPLVASRELRLKLTVPEGESSALITLTADDLADGNEQDLVVWKQARIEFPPQEGEAPISPLPVRDLRRVDQYIRLLQAEELPRTAQYLHALEQAHSTGDSLESLAKEAQLIQPLLERWAAMTGIAGGGAPRVKGHFTQKNAKVHGYDGLNGWGPPETPSLLTNSSDQPITISTLTVPPHGLTLHPSPTLEAFVAWRSPVTGEFRIAGRVADADDKCGNGGTWRLEHHATGLTSNVVEGAIDNGGVSEIQPESAIDIKAGDVILLAIGPRDGNHSCDTTYVELQLTEVGGESRVWNLSDEVVDRILDGNPLADTRGHPEVWHFGSRETQSIGGTALPGGTMLAKWRAAVTDGADPAAVVAAARQVESLLVAADPTDAPEVARTLRTSLLDWTGPLRWIAMAQSSSLADSGLSTAVEYGLDPARFGFAPGGETVDPGDLCHRAPQRIDFRIPIELTTNTEFVTNVRLHAESGGEGSIRAQATLNQSGETHIAIGDPIIVHPGSPAEQRWNAACGTFRELFPRALCYSRIVPVDEVVTLTLYYREDDHLQRLMLDESQTAELNRLWDELLFVSEEPHKLVVALEQIREFATQDRPDLVTVFDPLKTPIGARAERFRERQTAAEPAHVDGVVDFAAAAWRRPLTQTEQSGLYDFYAHLRSEELPHQEAVKLLLARVLTSTEFLFKVEQAPAGAEATPVTARELANRLSFFLWSSVPDEQLNAGATAGRLQEETVLVDQTGRMLRDPRTRRLAVHFACQWLHIRGFAENDEKNEALFPEFDDLKGPMEQEALLFFEDLLRNDRSLLDILTADHTFLNEPLARHYGLDWPVAAPQDNHDRVIIGDADWQRVDGIQVINRGGVLGLAAVLASQSGASRTSPILRGNWVYETVLGEKLPKPPPGVPQLPETLPSGLTERELIEQHSSVAACARCHIKIDPYGFALEQFDTIGRLRAQPVDTRTTLPGGQSIEGLAGLRSYLANERRDDFVHQFCRKLLGYALGREVQLSDEPLLAEMQRRLRENDYRVSIAIEAIVTSPQFRRIRGADYSVAE